MSETESPQASMSDVELGVDRCDNCDRAAVSPSVLWGVKFCDRRECRRERKASRERGYVEGYKP